MGDRPKGPFGVDPLHFSVFLFGVLVLFVMYLLLPKAIRKQYFGAYPKRHAWSARIRARRGGGRSSGGVRVLDLLVLHSIACVFVVGLVVVIVVELFY